MADSAGEKKHEATPYRRQKAREQGQVARSQDLGSALILLLAVVMLWAYGPDVLKALAEIMTVNLTAIRFWDLSERSAAGMIASSINHCLWALLPIMLGVCGIALVNNWFQVGFLLLPEKLNFDFKRVSPLAGAKRLVDLPNITRLGIGLVTAVIVLDYGVVGT